MTDPPPGPPAGWIPGPYGWEPTPPGWVPPPDWVHTAWGWLPPGSSPTASATGAPLGGWPAQSPAQSPAPAPGGWSPYPPAPMAGGWAGYDPAPDAATRGFGWTRVLPTARQRAAQLRDRTPSGWEIVLVLAVFPLSAVLSALLALTETLTAYHGAHRTFGTTYVGAGAVFYFLEAVTELVPAALVIYLLSLSGGGLRAIGLDLTRPRADVARCGKVVLYTYIPGFFVLAILIVLTPHHADIANDAPTQALVYFPGDLVRALGAGVVEEIVVLGFLVHRLEQRGWDGWQLYAVCMAVRISYHLYYGTGALGLLIWAGMTVFLYRRRRRLLTFIVAHVLWDTQAFARTYLPDGTAWFWGATGVVVAVFVVLWLVGRAPAAEEMKESARAAARGEDALPAARGEDALPA